MAVKNKNLKTNAIKNATRSVKEVFESDFVKEFFDQKIILDLLDRHYQNKENTLIHR